MIVRKGGRLGNGVAGKGFFEMFYRWSRLGCSGQRYLHTKLPNRTSSMRRWRPISPSQSQLRHQSASKPNDEEPKAAEPSPSPGSSTSSPHPKSEPQIIRTHHELKPRTIRKISYEAPNIFRTVRVQVPELIPAHISARRVLATPQPDPLPPTAVTPSPLHIALRATMRTLPHPTVILTTTTKPQPNSLQNRERRAMTLSSFTTVSLPDKGRPVISFNIKHPSLTLEALKETRIFFIHVLDATPAGARLASDLSKGGGGKDWFRRLYHMELFSPRSEELDKQRVRVVDELVGRYVGKEGENIVVPRLEGPGIKKVLRCEIGKGYGSKPSDDGFVRVQDHVVCLAVVKEVLGGLEGGGLEEVALGYAGGEFRGVGEVLDVNRKEVTAEDAVTIEEGQGEDAEAVDVKEAQEGNGENDVDELGAEAEEAEIEEGEWKVQESANIEKRERDVQEEKSGV